MHEHPIDSGAGEPLTMRERNAIRYMAEYVAVKLLKRYKKPSTHPQVDFKWKLFVRVLKEDERSRPTGDIRLYQTTHVCGRS